MTVILTFREFSKRESLTRHVPIGQFAARLIGDADKSIIQARTQSFPTLPFHAIRSFFRDNYFQNCPLLDSNPSRVSVDEGRAGHTIVQQPSPVRQSIAGACWLFLFAEEWMNHEKHSNDGP